MIKRTIDIKRYSILFMGLLAMGFYSSASNFEKDKGRLLEIVKAYADAMIENGRDTYGDEHSPLFAGLNFPDMPGK